MTTNIGLTTAIEQLSNRDISDMHLVYKEDFLNHLNHEQKVAATRKEGNFLVIAGPGSGKTHTLAYRVVFLVKNGVDPKSIVVITFTRKAGRELRERISQLLPNTTLGFIGTFHGFSHHISTKIGSSSPMSGFRLLDAEDDIQVHKLVMADFKVFKKSIKPRTLQKLISYCNNTQLTVSEYIKKFDVRKLKEDAELIEEYRDKYERYKAEHLLANYDDMITLVSRYLRKTGEKKVTADFDYLMIDEYQDTNQMQLDFVKQLGIEHVMAIGDDFQGIYAFRGADHRIILNFVNDFPNAQMIKLKDNYRSTEPVVNFINQTVERSTLGYHKKFRVTRSDEGKAKVVQGKSIDAHKKFILDHIKKLPTNTHALIYRYNKNRTIFEKMLIENDIDYSVYGGIRLLERKHIKDVMAFLMLYLNRLDIVSFNRVLNLLPGVGPKTARKLIDTQLEDLSLVPLKKREHLEQIKSLLSFKGKKESLYSEITAFYFSIYDAIANDTYTKDEIREDFKLVYDLLKTYESLNNFVIHLILEPVIDFNKGDKPKVVLTTIHSAKGLEFDHVYYFHTHDWYKNYDVETLEEDRRLFYVGISRAKENLFIFDHTGYCRPFEMIIRDFDNQSSYQPEKVFSSKSDTEDTAKQVKVVETPEITVEDIYEQINGMVFEKEEHTLEHQHVVTNIASEMHMFLKKKPYRGYIGPSKLQLNEHIVQPDYYVLKDDTFIPTIIVEVVSDASRTKDMVQKMDLYMRQGVHEYWIVEPQSKMVMVHTYENLQLKGTKIAVMNQQVVSQVIEDIEIDIEDIFA